MIGVRLAAFLLASVLAFPALAQPSQTSAIDRGTELWDSIGTALTGPDGPVYWESYVKDADIPGGANGVNFFSGTVIELRAGEILVAVTSGSRVDAVLKLKRPIAQPLRAGMMLRFRGTATEYHTNPYQLIFDAGEIRVFSPEDRRAAEQTPKPAEPPSKPGQTQEVGRIPTSTAGQVVAQAELWTELRRHLTGPGNEDYWEMNVHNIFIPSNANHIAYFLGRVVSIEESNSGKEVLIAVIPGTQAEARMKIDQPLAKALKPGMLVAFAGAAARYRVRPFEIAFEVTRIVLAGLDPGEKSAGQQK